MDNVQTILTTVASVIAGTITLWRLVKKELNKTQEQTQKNIQEHLAFELQKLNGFVDALLESMPYPAWVKLYTVDDDGKSTLRMKYINTAYEKLFGISRYQYIGKTDFEVWPPDIAGRYYANDMAVIGSGKPITFEELTAIPGQTDPEKYLYEKLLIDKDKYKGVVGFMKPEEWYKATHHPDSIASWEEKRIVQDAIETKPNSETGKNS